MVTHPPKTFFVPICTHRISSKKSTEIATSYHMARTPGRCWNPRGLLGPQHTVLLAVIWTHSKIAPAFRVFVTTGTTQVLYICRLADVRNFETRHWILMHVQECDYQVIRCSEWKFAAHLLVIYRLFWKAVTFRRIMHAWMLLSAFFSFILISNYAVLMML